MKKLLSILCSVLSFAALAQKGNADDSLLNVLKTSKEDTNKANVLIQLCRNNLDLNNKAVAKYAAELMTLSKKTNFTRGKADAYNFFGIIEDINANYSKALDLYDTALVLAKSAKLERKSASIDNNIGLIYWKIGDQQKALGYYYDALRVFEKLEEKKLAANVLSNIGLIHSSLRDNEKALDFHRKALDLRQSEGDEYGMASTYNNMAKSYTLVDKEDSSRYVTRLAMAIQEKSGDRYGMGISTANLGMSYSSNKMYDSAIYYLQKSIELRKQENDKLGLIYSYSALAEDLQETKHLKEALKYAEMGLAIAKEINSKERISTTSKVLAKIYRDMGNYEMAFKYIVVYSNYLSDIFDTVKTAQAEELAVKYEVEKKDLLIQKDQAELKNKQAQIENQDLKLSQRNMQLSLLGILLVATGLTSYQFYNRNRLKHEARLQQEIINQQDIASKAIIEAEERERKRIAGDLHDGLGQLCSAIKMNLSNLESQVGFSDKDAAISYEKTLAMTDQACRDVRSISHQMMPNVLLKAGLATAVRDFLDKIDSRVLQVHLDVFGLQQRLGNNIETVLYRVIQEVVNNVIKHSGANSLYIQLSKDDDGISATIEDNGTGFDINEMETFSGIGLKNISSRISFLRGTVEFDSAPGRGTVVSIWVPA